MNRIFLTTTDEATALLLRKAGFQETGNYNGIYSFLNTDRIQFSSDIDKTKIKYSDMLYT